MALAFHTSHSSKTAPSRRAVSVLNWQPLLVKETSRHPRDSAAAAPAGGRGAQREAPPSPEQRPAYQGSNPIRDGVAIPDGSVPLEELKLIDFDAAEAAAVDLAYTDRIRLEELFEEHAIRAVLAGCHANYFFTHPAKGRWPINDSFVERYHKRWNEYPSFEADGAYTALYLLKAAVEKANGLVGGWPEDDAIIACSKAWGSMRHRATRTFGLTTIRATRTP
jgi:hypothetical protein